MWHLSMHGSTDHLDPEVAAEAEVAVRDAAAKILGELAPAGHQGIAGQFQYSHGSPSDLRDPSAPAAETPAEPATDEETDEPTDEPAKTP
jgi:hypothetical protein